MVQKKNVTLISFLLFKKLSPDKYKVSRIENAAGDTPPAWAFLLQIDDRGHAAIFNL